MGWLPKAIAAPTPVRALVHRRTLVTAGIFLIFFFCYYLDINLSGYLIFRGLFSGCLSRFLAIFEVDVKKLVAWRTLSQIRLCFLLFGFGYYFYAFVHLIRHALFKRFLFIKVGFFIIFDWGRQDSRIIKNKVNFYFLNLGFIIRLLGLFALFFTGGILTKELFLDLFYSAQKGFIFLFFIIFYLVLTYFYTLKLG